MRNFSWLRFSRGERTGIAILLFLLGSCFCFDLIVNEKKEPFPADSVFYERLSLFFEAKDSFPERIRGRQSARASVLPLSGRHRQILPIELNSAEAEALEALPGIGEKLALRILKYRSLLGGFASVEQLLEVYGISPPVYEKIAPFLRVDTLKITKIGIDTASFRTLLRHPYLSFDQVQLLFRLKEKKNLKTWNAFRGWVADSLFLLLKPYCQ